ncbi:N-acetylglucosamine-6-sulfatase-like isoform X2 [Zootermopsis nevadensis]|uniref:N-acetylglucosamine-6-sulfatase-like isoform X2 n=1 Tax=Zootermopsis nevadensis TaxID=136037 RepID=UPI000B8E28DB|nr:N-acetylglucosamine-6-sulfatase-like isoform X2 [Zootermopsis nevadensis]
MEKLLLLSSFTIMLTWMVPGSCSQTNIVLIIADDQDLILGGLFVTTPICCPSRASIFSGQYQHNHLTLNNSVSGGCSGPHWQQRVEPQTWPAILHQAGYTTFYAGKYLNQYGYKKTGGVAHVPPGWDWWIGLVGNSRYYNYTLSVNGTSVFHSDDYFTNLIKMYGLEFLHQRHVKEKNFLMVLAPPAPHAPFTPAPEYKDSYKNVTAMRTPNFNIPVFKDKHWLLRMSPSPLPDSMLPELDRVYRQRWETLLSVDDLVESIVIELYSLGLLDNTYLIVTSDHGYHVGQFGLPWDKRQPYEMDIRIPLMMRGPGLPRKQKDVRPVLNIDFAPTFLAMAGLEPPAWMDGLPFFPLLQQNANNGTKIDRKFLIEYHGEGSMKTISSDCPSDYSDTLSTCVPEQMCKCQDSKNNSYTCVRHLEDLISNHNFSYDFIFCKFRDSENFTEAYDLNVDPYQLNNLAPYLSSIIENKYITWLDHLKFCSGLTCHMYHDLNVQNSP